MQRNAPLKAFPFDETSRKTSVTQELAAARGAPPAFRKQLELHGCIFPHSTQFHNRLNYDAVRCVASS